MKVSLTQHFALDEFACRDRTQYPIGNKEIDGKTWLETRLKPLCAALEAIRTACGDRAIYISSGFRSAPYNYLIKGAKLSQHVQGRAVDFEVNGMPPSDVHKIVLQLFKDKKIEIGGVGVYPGWVHIDVRPRPTNGRLARWKGIGLGSEVA